MELFWTIPRCSNIAYKDDAKLGDPLISQKNIFIAFGWAKRNEIHEIDINDTLRRLNDFLLQGMFRGSWYQIS